MSERSPLRTLAASPTVIGAITTLIVIVAVFLAYNANNGLPFVPTYRVTLDVPNASRLSTNNEVRIGGSRVGVVESIGVVDAGSAGPASEESFDDADVSSEQGTEALETDTSVEDDPEVAARLTLRLDENVGPLPKDSIFRVRYRSSFGLKYLEVTRGDGEDAPEGFAFDGTNDVDPPDDADGLILSLEEAETNPGAADGTFIEQTEFDDIGNTFDQRTRNAGRENLVGFGDAVTGRGRSLNEAIAALNPFLGDLKPVARILAARSTRLRRLFPELGDFARIVAPVAEQQAELFSNMATAFGAISADPEALKESISETPPTLQTAIRTLPAQQRFLAEFTDLSVRLRPGVRQLRLALPDLNSAVENGAPVLADSPPTNRKLGRVFESIEDLVEEPTTLLSLQRLQRTFDKTDSLMEWVTPAQTVCNYFNYWMTMLPEHLSAQDTTGYLQRVSIIASPNGPITVQAGPAPLSIAGEAEIGLAIGGYSGLQANGRAGEAALEEPGYFEPHELPILHANPTGPTGQNGSDCQAGQTGYPLGQLRAPGQPRSNPAIVVADLPGDRGPTTAFWKRDGTRIFKDTRVPARQP